MKKRNKITLWITIPLLSLLLIGGGITYMVNETIIKPEKQAEEKQKARKEAEIAFLKKNESIMSDYIKSVSTKAQSGIETVTFQWDTVSAGISDGSNPVAKVDTLDIDAYVNEDKKLDVTLFIKPNNFRELDYISIMGVAAPTQEFTDAYGVDGTSWKGYGYNNG